MVMRIVAANAMGTTYVYESFVFGVKSCEIKFSEYYTLTQTVEKMDNEMRYSE